MNIQNIRDRIIKYALHNKRTAIIAPAVIILAVVLLIVINASGNDPESFSLDSNSSAQNPSAPKEVGDGEYDYTEAVDHIGEKATVTGVVEQIFTSKSGTVFFDFCDNFETCPFSAVVFASDVPKFKDLEQYKRAVKLTGLIKSYQGKAEIILNGPEQVE